MTWLQILWMPSIIRVRDVISGCDQAFLHFLAAWLHRKNEPKKKLTRIDSGAPSWTVTPAISRILFYGSKKKAVWSISRYVHHAAHAIHCASFIEFFLQLLWTGRITEWRKQSYYVRDRLRFCTAGSTTVNTSELPFWFIIAIQSSCKKMKERLITVTCLMIKVLFLQNKKVLRLAFLCMA